VANAAILKLTNELQFVEKTLAAAAAGELRSGPASLFVDRIFENEVTCK
jgi:hypothetical protein